jgi:hypothetical protein
MGDAVLGGDAGQLQGGFQIGGAVVDAGEQVVVEIDHFTRGLMHGRTVAVLAFVWA